MSADNIWEEQKAQVGRGAQEWIARGGDVQLLREGRQLAIPQQIVDRQDAALDTSEPRIVLRSLLEIILERREPAWLIRHVLEKGVLAVLSGKRGTFKSFIALDWSLQIAIAGHGVIRLSAEGDGLGRRAKAWLDTREPNYSEKPFKYKTYERPINLNQREEMGELVGEIDGLDWTPDLIVIDTLSKFSAGLDENKNSEVAAFLSGLSRSLRERYDCTVLLVCHAGHGDDARPRGASALMANPDAEYLVRRPDPTGPLVTVSRERFKDTASLPPLAYTSRVVELDYPDDSGDPVTSLILDPTDAPPRTPLGIKGRGKNQDKVLAGLRQWVSSANGTGFITNEEYDRLLKAQKFDRKRGKEVTDWLLNSEILVRSVGSYLVQQEKL